MTDKLKKIITDEVTKLPKENQEALNALDWVKIVEEIGGKYLLNDGQINDLVVETLLVLIGNTEIQFFAINIENQVGTIKDDATQIALEINQKIFIPINDMLVKNIKEGLKGKRIKWDQNLNFILSGGDYVNFVEQREAENSVPMKPKMSDIKSKLVI